MSPRSAPRGGGGASTISRRCHRPTRRSVNQPSAQPVAQPVSHPGDGSVRVSVALGTVTVLLTLLGWSSIPLFLRHFAESIDPWTSNGWRYGFSALVWLPVLVAASLLRPGRGLPRGLWIAAIVPSVVNAAGQVCFTWAHYRIDPGLLTFGLRTQLIFVAIGAWILFPRERAVIRTRSYLIGALLLLGGSAGVLLGPGVEFSAAHVEGVLLAIGSGLLFAAYGLAVRKYMDGMHPVIAFAVICQYTAGAMVLLMLLFGDSWGLTALELGTEQFLFLLLSAIVGIAIGHVFYYVAITHLGVAVAAGVLQLQPFIVAIASRIVFGETLTWVQWTAGFVAVAGALLMLGVQRLMAKRKVVPRDAPTTAEGESGS